jgi:pimeloyl-ACP methyl ester carboxylesterase
MHTGVSINSFLMNSTTLSASEKMTTSENLATIDQGSGEAIVFLHGYPMNKSIWQHFANELQDNYRVICLDLPGFGNNPAIELPLTVGDMAEAVNKTLDNLGVEKCVMVGHSLGGYVALGFGEKYPNKLNGLVMFHSTAFADSQEKKQGRNKSIDFVERYGVSEFVDEFISPLFFEGRKQELKDSAETVMAMGRATAKSTVVEVIKAMRDRKDRTKVLEKANFPVMYIVGRNDTAVQLSIASPQFWMAKNATTHILDETGHMGMLERPKETLTLMRQFLQRVFA